MRAINRAPAFTCTHIHVEWTKKILTLSEDENCVPTVDGLLPESTFVLNCTISGHLWNENVYFVQH